MEQQELKCTSYEPYDEGDPLYFPCHCPACGGFLSWERDKPICKKCGTELLAIPDKDEFGEELPTGKICPISLPKRRRADAKT